MREPPLGEDPCGGPMGDTQKLIEKHHAIIEGPLGDAWGIPPWVPRRIPPQDPPSPVGDSPDRFQLDPRAGDGRHGDPVCQPSCSVQGAV